MNMNFTKRRIRSTTTITCLASILFLWVFSEKMNSEYSGGVCRQVSSSTEEFQEDPQIDSLQNVTVEITPDSDDDTRPTMHTYLDLDPLGK